MRMKTTSPWSGSPIRPRPAAAVQALEANETEYGAGEIFSGPSLKLLYNDPLIDPRTPDIIVAPNVGVVYTGGKKKISEHGGRAQDDTNVMLLVSNPAITATTYSSPVFTTQIAPTILGSLRYRPEQPGFRAGRSTRLYCLASTSPRSHCRAARFRTTLLQPLLALDTASLTFGNLERDSAHSWLPLFFRVNQDRPSRLQTLRSVVELKIRTRPGSPKQAII